MTNSEVKKDSPSEERILLPEVKDPLLALKEYLLKVTKALPTVPQEACLSHLPQASAKADDVLSPSVPFRFSSLSLPCHKHLCSDGSGYICLHRYEDTGSPLNLVAW